MKAQLLFACLLTIALMSFSGDNKKKHKNGWDEDQLKGKVKSIKETSYASVKIKDGVMQGDSLDYTYETHFDEKGNKTAFINYNASEVLVETAVYYYNSKNLNAVDTTWYYTDDGTLSYKEVNHYDDKGNPNAQDELYDMEDPTYTKIVAKYEGDNEVEEDTYGNDGKLASKYTYTYDGSGNQLEFRHQVHDTMKIYYSFKYDAQGNEIESDRYKSNGDIGTKTLNKYDDKGNDIERTVYESGKLDYKLSTDYDATGHMTGSTFYRASENSTMASKYEYDAQGNQVKSVDYINGLPSSMTVFTIVYY